MKNIKFSILLLICYYGLSNELPPSDAYVRDSQYNTVSSRGGASCGYYVRGETRIRILDNIDRSLLAYVKVTVNVTGSETSSQTFGPETITVLGQNAHVSKRWSHDFEHFGIYECQGESWHRISIDHVPLPEYHDPPAVIETVNCEWVTQNDDNDGNENQDDAHCFGGDDDNFDDCSSPIIIDLGHDGFHFGEAGMGVEFDILGTGEYTLMQWVRPGENDAFLVLDSGNGIVDDGSELFGQGSRIRLEGNRNANDGFEALAQWDSPALGGNNDGVISKQDDVWQHLLLWLDINADGLATLGEMLTLDLVGIDLLYFDPIEEKIYDRQRNWLRYWDEARTFQQNYFQMVDVFFQNLSKDPSFPESSVE